MNTFIHKKNDTSVCIYRHTEYEILGSFFNEKPQIGDLIVSHAKRSTNFVYVYMVTEIKDISDTIVASGCKHNGHGAKHLLSVKNVTNEKLIDNSLRIL